ncbi:hypothetical protein FDECE_11308 [Fusarium decemcellulare]|nr:hypothetical protein FDECE_11308 [Fusarium decemcellulare]
MADTSRKRKRTNSTSEPNTKSTPPFDCFEKIAPEGDVVFVLAGQTRVRVNSAIMRTMSPVFNRMLGPNFKEGRALAAATDGTPVEVLLPNDDDEAFGWICRVLHCQADTNLWLPQLEKLVQVLELADKYEFVKAMELSIEFWISKRIRMMREVHKFDIIDFWHLSLACHRLHASKSFELVTRELVYYHDEPFFKLASAMELEPRTSQLASTRVIYRLAYDNGIKHSGIYSETLTAITDYCEDLLSDLWSHECGDSEKGWDCAACVKSCYESIRNLQDRISHGLNGLCLACFDHSKTSECTAEHNGMKGKELKQFWEEQRDHRKSKALANRTVTNQPIIV